MHLRGWSLLLLGLAACAPTIVSTAPQVEVLVVLDGRGLRVIPVDAPGTFRQIDIPPGAGTPTTLAVRGSTAIVGLSDADEVAIVDLVNGTTVSLPLGALGTVTSVGFSDDGLGYATTSNTGVLTQFNPAAPAATVRNFAYVAGPRGVASARGQLFVLFGPRAFCLPDGPICEAGPGWLSHFADATHLDSIPTRFGGDPVAASLAQDGTLYVLNRGGESVSGSLSAIDPIRGVEIESYASVFGLTPSYMAFDGIEHLFVASKLDGLMVFNTVTRRVERGVGSGIPLPGIPRALVTDAAARIYVVEAVGCGGTVQGRIRVFGRDLVERSLIPVGSCPVAAAVTEIPAPQD